MDEVKESWKKRQTGIKAPYFSLYKLVVWDSQLNQQLSNFYRSNQTWALLENYFSNSEYQLHDLFPAASLAFSAIAPPDWRDFLLELIETDEQQITALIEALGWLPLDNSKDHLLQLLEADNPLHQRIAIAACTLHRSDVGDYLTNALQSDDPELRTCALKAAGELGRFDLLPALCEHLTAESADWRFWAAWSAARMGERQKTPEILQTFTLTDNPFRHHALTLLPRILTSTQRQHWLETIKQKAVHPRDAITSIGAAGDPDQIPWLIAQMDQPELARAAGEAFTLITGLDLPEHHLAQPPEPNTNSKDPMRGLPWPNPKAITEWWQNNANHFQRETRYLLGHPITPDHCLQVLVNGYQRQRAAAALELALIQTGMPLFAVHAPAAEQQELLNVRDTLQTCVESAACLWQQRDCTVHAPMTTLPELTEIDSQIEQQLTLLREAGDLGWQCCWESLNANRQPGSVFTAAATAVSHPNDAPFECLTDYVNTNPDAARELIAALGWVSPDHLRGRVQNLLTAASPVLRYIGITVCGLHQVDPGHHLEAILKDTDLRLRARALRVVGELRLQHHLPVLQQHLHHPNETWRFWAAWSAGLLGDSNGLEELQSLIEYNTYNTEPAAQQQAMALLVHSMELEPARIWIRQLLVDEQLTPLVIYGLGVLGEITAVPWLMHRMREPDEHADLAGVAFGLITGVDLVKENLVSTARSSGNESQPEHLSLPHPDADAVERWWNQQRHRFKQGRCYLMGFPISQDVCWQVLVHGWQGQRAVAASYLALAEVETALFPVEAPAFRQWEWLSAPNIVIQTDDDANSTQPQQVRRQAGAKSSLGSLIDPILDTPVPSELPQEQDYSHAAARSALAEMTQPLSRGCLFRRKALSVATAGKPNQDLLHEDEPTIAPPDPTTAAILNARNLLAGCQTSSDDEVRSRAPSEITSQFRSVMILSPMDGEQYIEIIADLWRKRHILAASRYSLFSEICETDRYIRPYLDYLPEVEDGLWRKVEYLLAGNTKAGHLFAASFIALQDERIFRLRKVVNTTLAKTRIESGFLSVFSWLPPTLAKQKIQLLLNSKFVRWRRLGILAAMINPIDCANFLEKLAHDPDSHICSLALKAIGKLGYSDLKPLLLEYLNSTDREQQFWAAWSAVLLADRQDALETLKSFVLAPAPQQQKALALVLRVAAHPHLEHWLRVVVHHNPHLYSTIINTGVCNRISWIPWLIKLMQNPKHASYAGETFTLFTGVDLIEAGLSRPKVPNSKDKQLLDAVEPAQMLLPDARLVHDWWLAHQNQYRQDTRYFFGREISLDNCVRILNAGRQYQRAMAALELSLLKAEFPLLETQAASHQQQVWIEQFR